MACIIAGLASGSILAGVLRVASDLHGGGRATDAELGLAFIFGGTLFAWFARSLTRRLG
jgi:hypothetical protein